MIARAIPLQPSASFVESNLLEAILERMLRHESHLREKTIHQLTNIDSICAFCSDCTGITHVILLF